MARPLAAAGLALLCLSGCRDGGRLPEGAFRNRPPTPLDSLPLASDARFDTLGFLAGSFVGEGTARAVHLLSSDTGLIAELARRYAPDLPRGPALWEALRARGRVAIGGHGTHGESRLRTGDGSGPRVHQAMVGSPLGHTQVAVAALLPTAVAARSDAQAELIVKDQPEPGDPPSAGRCRQPALAEAPAHAAGAPRRQRRAQFGDARSGFAPRFGRLRGAPPRRRGLPRPSGEHARGPRRRRRSPSGWRREGAAAVRQTAGWGSREWWPRA
jgi:hypothetical protein